jgi:hypothetical protein
MPSEIKPPLKLSNEHIPFTTDLRFHHPQSSPQKTKQVSFLKKLACLLELGAFFCMEQ